jgi:lipopolysaccharide/colanic/teichoic acid biosynthesis glycosyltransferase
MVKHQVRPGSPGWAQVNGLRWRHLDQRRIEHDIFYISSNWSLLFDIKILF